MKQATYNNEFTWEAPYGEQVILHSDGACSVLVSWDGLDIDMLTQPERENRLQLINDIVTRLDNRFLVEFHLWREFDDEPARRYLAYSKNIKRNREFALRVRKELAEHLGPKGISNSVAVVLTFLPDKTPKLFLRGQLKQEAKRAEILLEQARLLASYLPGGKVAPLSTYYQRIIQSFQRNRFLRGAHFSYDPIYALNDQLISDVPTISDRIIEIDGQFVKVLFGFKYPDASPGWIIDLVSNPFAMHIVHAVIPTDTREALSAAGTSSKNTEGLLVDKGDDFQEEKITDLNSFRGYVTKNGLSILLNMFIVHVYGNTQLEVEANARVISGYFEKIVPSTSSINEDTNKNQAGDFRDANYIQKVYFRRGLPGQAYLGNRFRPDEHEQVTSMLPLQVWSSGEETAEIIHLSNSGQLITSSVTDKVLASRFIGGMTRAGKDAAHVCEVAQLYPLGLNYKFVEIEPTYRFACEAYGGKYCVLQPDESVINPLPPYSVAYTTTDINDRRPPLSSGIASNTIAILAPLLTDNKISLTRFEQTAAEIALQHLYAKPKPGYSSPLLEGLYVELEHLSAEYLSPDEIVAARSMASHLHSFLSTTAGNTFNQQDNIDISGDFVGIDLSKIWNTNQELAIFYLMFASLRFVQESFLDTTPTMIVLNELSQFVDLAPERIKTLCSSITRMGGKKSSFLTIITQHTSEVDALDPAVLAQMAYNNLCYMKSDHSHIAQILKVNDGPLERWRSFKYPAELSYREQILCHGDNYHHLHITLPDFLLDLANSSPRVLDIKEAVAKEYADPIQRMEMINKQLRGHSHA